MGRCLVAQVENLFSDISGSNQNFLNFKDTFYRQLYASNLHKLLKITIYTQISTNASDPDRTNQKNKLQFTITQGVVWHEKEKSPPLHL